MIIMLRKWMLVTIFCLLFSATAFAQATGSFNGRVVDPQGNTVPGVTVTATEVDTSSVRRTVTNEDGLYNLPSLEPGRYVIEASKDGFATAVERKVTLLVAQTLTINFPLTVSAVKQSVTVSSTAPGS